MPPSLRDASDPREWLRRARSNLIRAIEDRRLRRVVYEVLCFDAQQAAEKVIKAALLHQGAPIPRIHGLGELLALVRKQGTEIPASIIEAAALTEYAVTTAIRVRAKTSRRQSTKKPLSWLAEPSSGPRD